ncbi:unnamed protein product [Parascedosporium putredinis]|uniref:Major facilitator superfamily (MFS) profile domain-containing protein n=1 Tax=Parascedosporium putredinis TaxID=1442378 RepID=A0A9P1H6W0_9PEZI|nr:unnamed protein product [Parascedosporium putredinis]CAI7999289.1 unnamed protein product [Parascedosporium putredinis]
MLLMLPLVGDFAPPHRKASSISIVVSGLMLGMLVARLLSGIVSNYTDWRNVYWFSFGAQHLLLVALYFFMPDYPSTNPNGLRYTRVLWSIVHMLFTQPLLVQACLIALFMITDRYVPWLSSLLGLIIAFCGITISTFTGNSTIAGPVIQAVAVDVGIQMAQTANRTAIYTIDPKARNRLNTAYMVMAFCGQLSVPFGGITFQDAEIS